MGNRGRKQHEREGAAPGKTRVEVRKLRELAARSAAICGQCFAPLAPDAEVSMVGLPVLISAARIIPAHRVTSRLEASIAGIPVGRVAPKRRVPERTGFLRVPICQQCALPEQESFEGGYRSGQERLPCEGCGRPMYVPRPPGHYKRFDLYRNERVCCTECGRRAANERARLRRRVTHDEVTCFACGKSFTQTRSDATTCSNRCRQRLFRARQKAAS